jgi:S1-C subfamily serine protease
MRASALFALLVGVVAGCTGSNPTATPTTSSSSAQAAAPSSETSSVAAPSSATTAASSAAGGDLESRYVSTIRAVLRSVVLIQTDSGLGSGVVFDDSGDIVTNAHVVGSSTAFQITAANSAKPLAATLVGSYRPDDLAVVKVSEPAGLHKATFGDSSKLDVGDIVLAMGNPLGLSSSVTNGIVSAVGRTVTEPQDGNSPGATLRDMIQTSADINPGNSGGALVDLSGQVIGIPTLAAVDQQAGGAAPGIGFAISSNVAKDIAAQLIANGKVVDSRRAALGVSIATVADQQGNPLGAGIAALVAGGPAASAGLQVGDIIVGVDGHQVRSAQELSAVLATLKPGQTVPVDVQRAGSATTVNVTLGTLPG